LKFDDKNPAFVPGFFVARHPGHGLVVTQSFERHLEFA